MIRTPQSDLASRPSFRTLDWEFAGDNDPLFDLVGFGLGLQWTPAQLAACAAAYAATPAGQTRPLHATRERLADTVCAYQIREYAWAVAQIAAGNDRPEIIEQAVTMRRAVVEPR